MKKSSVQRLPKNVRDYLNELLRGEHTQIEATEMVNTHLKALGLDVKLTKSSVNRYAKKMDEYGRKIRQSREIAEAFIGKIGSQPAGKVGHLLNEMVRTLAFDLTLDLDKNKVTPKLIGQLALAVQRLEMASAESEKRERQIKQAMAVEVEKALTKKGFDKETLKSAVKTIYGLAN